MQYNIDRIGSNKISAGNYKYYTVFVLDTERNIGFAPVSWTEINIPLNNPKPKYIEIGFSNTTPVSLIIRLFKHYNN